MSRYRATGALTAIALVIVSGACANAGSNKTTSATTTAGGTVTTFAGDNFTKNIPVTAPGVTATEIHVGSITSETNPLGANNGLLNDGIKAYFGVVNAKGGVWGRTLKLTSARDDQTGNNLTETEALLGRDNVYSVFEAVELFTGAKNSRRPASRRSAGTSTPSGRDRRTSSRTCARSAGRRSAARSDAPCRGS